MTVTVRLTDQKWHEMYYRIPKEQNGNWDRYYNCVTDELKCFDSDGTDHYLKFDTEEEAVLWTLKYL